MERAGPLVGHGREPYHGWSGSDPPPDHHEEARSAAMSKKKDCFGSETYVCQTRSCAYVSECVQAVWDKKLKRILARRPDAAPSAALTRTPGGVRLRAKEFTPGGSA